MGFTPDVYYNNTKNYTVYYVSKEYVVIENQTGNYTEEYIYQDNALVAQVDTNGNKIAVHPDHEGSSTTFTDSQGNLLETTFYSAYGEILSGGKTSRFDYEGKEFDSVIQDYDFGFRKYKPDPPIFTQPDTLIQNIYDPQGLNRYSFERNNPLRNTDEDGHVAGIIVFLVIVGAISAGLIWYNIIVKGGKHPAMGADVSNDPLYQKYTQELIENKDGQVQDTNGQQIDNIPQGNAMTPNYEKIIEESLKNINLDFDPKDLVIDDEDKKDEELPLCEKCYKRLQVDEKGQAIIVTFNEQGQEVSRSSSGGGSYGGGSTVYQTESGTWVCNGCDDQGFELP